MNTGDKISEIFYLKDNKITNESPKKTQKGNSFTVESKMENVIDEKVNFYKDGLKIQK